MGENSEWPHKQFLYPTAWHKEMIFITNNLYCNDTTFQPGIKSILKRELRLHRSIKISNENNDRRKNR